MKFMRSTRHETVTLAGEIGGLLLAAPALYFPNWFPSWMLWVSLMLLASLWCWRRVRLNLWHAPTPADWPLFFLFAVMLPLAVWAAPPTLRAEYALPRASILLWNFCLFYAVVTYSSLLPGALRIFTWGFFGAAGALALLAPLGINWSEKFGFLPPFYNQIPGVLRGVFAGAENGFSPNQVAGTLLYILPLLYALVVFAPAAARRRAQWWGVALLALYMTGVMVLTQSRAGLLGLSIGVLLLALLPFRKGRWGLALAGGALLVLEPLWLSWLLGQMSTGGAAERQDAVTLFQRQEIWTRALYAIQDFSFTGMGLGAFRGLLPLLYPLATMAPTFDVAHAHNFFLQSALDFGVPGLVALLAIYLAVAAQLVQLGHTPGPSDGTLPLQGTWRTWALGIGCALAAQTVYSQLDAVAMGSKPNFLFWWLLALVLGSANSVRQERSR
jgi:putative inorganic carbon (hco3(-)) transporter